MNQPPIELSQLRQSEVNGPGFVSVEGGAEVFRNGRDGIHGSIVQSWNSHHEQGISSSTIEIRSRKRRTDDIEPLSSMSLGIILSAFDPLRTSAYDAISGNWRLWMKFFLLWQFPGNA